VSTAGDVGSDAPRPSPPLAPLPPAIPCNPEVARRARVGPEPTLVDDVARIHWPEIAPLGRHGYASSRLTMGVVLGLVAGALADADTLVALFHGPRGDALAWLLALGVPTLAGAYRLLLARWDQDQARYGGGRVPVSLDDWRAATEKTDDGRGRGSRSP
jgi:hypothetical protein